jgi:hypothetical protein
MTRLPSLIVEKRPDAKGTPFLHPLIIFAYLDPAEQENSDGLLPNISHPILIQFQKRIEDKGPFPFPFFLLITINRENSYSVKVFSSQ